MEIVEEFHAKQTNYQSYIAGLTLQLCSFLTRNFALYTLDIKPNNNKRKENISFALGYITSHYTEKISLDDICNQLHLNKSYLSREFKYFTDINIVYYINQLRCEYAKKLLFSKEYSITEISHMCGFETTQYFSNIFKKHIVVSPSMFVKSILN